MDRPFHPSDDDSILFNDAEMPAPPAAVVEAHLGYFADCRGRMKQLRSTLADYGKYHDSVLKPAFERRAEPWPSLGTRLAHAEKPQGSAYGQGLGWGDAALPCVAVALATYQAFHPREPAMGESPPQAAALAAPPHGGGLVEQLSHRG